MKDKEEVIFVSIAHAIKSQDLEKLASLFSEHPEQVNRIIPLGRQTWLGYAASREKPRVVKYLIDIGVDVNKGDERDGRKPICNAASKGNYDIVKCLLDAGTVLDVSASVRNPLFGAITSRSPAITQLLLEAGIDSTARYNSDTMKNMDAVAFALMWGDKESARLIALRNAKGDEKMAVKALEEADKIAEENAR
ncbi:ankyrin repeat domain-containing protein [Halomonas organivorans]|uniref:Ankyrin repeat protein n=1 Tax=Halomonas organivorans TaxID=257772 RepID=A0A7W5G711_9GAMM|nr:ankyrin repeat domain-containing protein [Halomonas organivorans]MBB3142760.1 ankyrin repeat protein [Halomonas organivorans]